MMSDGNPITVTAQADRNFVILLNAYKHLKAIKKIALISVLLVAMVPFAWGVSAAAVVLTLHSRPEGTLNKRNSSPHGTI